MSQSQKRQRPGGGAQSQCNSSDNAKVQDVSVGGKCLAVLWYCQGVRTLEETQRAFDTHPSWRSA